MRVAGTHLTETTGITFLRHILDEFRYALFASVWNNRTVSSATTLFTLNFLKRQNLPVDYSGTVRSIFVLTLNLCTYINPYSALVGVQYAPPA